MDVRRIIGDIGKIVDRVGWAVIELEASSHRPSCAYTIGLDITFAWPELICFGLAPSQMRDMLNAAVSELQKMGRTPEPSVRLENVVQGYACNLSSAERVLVVQEPTLAHQFATLKRNEPTRVRTLQLLWPDQNGLFPGEPHCSAQIRKMQAF
jgi:hypothetical protein